MPRYSVKLCKVEAKRSFPSGASELAWNMGICLTSEGTSPISSRAPAALSTIPGDPAPGRPHRAHSRQPDPQPNHQAAFDRPNSAPPTADAIRQYPATEQQALHLMEAPKPEPAEQPPQKSSRPAAPMLIWRQRPRLQRMQIRDRVHSPALMGRGADRRARPAARRRTRRSAPPIPRQRQSSH